MTNRQSKQTLAVPRAMLVTRLPKALCPTGWQRNWQPPRLRKQYRPLFYVPWLCEMLAAANIPRVTDDEWRMAIERLTFEAEEGCEVSLEALRLIRPEIAERIDEQTDADKPLPSAALTQVAADNQSVSAGKPR